MSTHRGPRHYSDAEREQRIAADAAIREDAAQLLADPSAVAELIARLLAIASPRLLRYSLRNAAMLVKQSQDRGMALSDVDSFRGWAQRGRRVRRGERGLRIVAPKGRASLEQDGVETTDTAAAGEQDEQESGLVRFRMVAVFDISQTNLEDEGTADEDTATCEQHEATDPVAVLRTSLSEQITRMGYTVLTTGTAAIGTAAVDAGACTVTAAASDVVGLARGLAELLLTRSRSNHSAPGTVTAAIATGQTVSATG